MEIVSLREYCKLCFKIHYVKDFFVTFFHFFFRERKRQDKCNANKLSSKKAKRKTVGDFERLTFKEWNEVQCIHFYKNARPRFAFSGYLTRKCPKVCYVRRKSGLKSQADRSVRQADSGGRLDSYVSPNKAMGIGFQRKGGNRNPQYLH